MLTAALQTPQDLLLLFLRSVCLNVALLARSRFQACCWESGSGCFSRINSFYSCRGHAGPFCHTQGDASLQPGQIDVV